MDNITQALQRMPIDQVINWSLVSKQQLSETFIDDNHEYLDWTVVSATQALPPWLVQKYKEKIDFQQLSCNKNLSPETVTAFIDRMDIDLSQQNHRYTDDMILAWQEDLNPSLLLQFQKLSISTIMNLSEREINNQQFDNCATIVNVASQYQVMNHEFYDFLIKIERLHNEWTPDQQIKLFDRAIVLTYQKELPEQWVLDNLVQNDLDLRKIMLENFPCSDITVLTYIVNNPEIVDYRKILKVQKIREAVLYYILELNKENATEFSQIMIKHQNYDVTFLQKVLRDHNPEGQGLLYNDVFLRTLKPQKPGYLPWSAETISRDVLPNLALDDLAVTNMQEYFPEILDYLLKNPNSFSDFSYYKFISSNPLNDETLSKLEPTLNSLEYWYAFYKNKNSLSKTYILKNENKLKWWRQIPSSMLLDFSQRCLQCTESTDLYCLLNAFVHTAPREFLSNEKLPEWFIEILARFKSYIERKLKGVSFWWKIGRHQTLSPEFMDVHCDDLELKNILIYQNLSHDQLNRFAEFYDTECWYYVARYQSPSTEFLTRYATELPAYLV